MAIDDEIDPDTAPAVMPAQVLRVVEGGYPSRHLLTWEMQMRSWYKTSIVNMNKRFTEVKDELGDITASVTTLAEAHADLEEAFATYQVTVATTFGDVNARVDNEITARSGADSSLALSINNVQANVDSISASGQVFLYAKAAPAGATAAYGWFLTAGNAYAGMEALALSGGGSAIGFSSNQFRFVDSGTAQTVWTYGAGQFHFTGNVAIDGNLTITGTINTPAIAGNAASQVAFADSGGTYTGVGVTVRSGSSGVLIIATFRGKPGTYFPLGTAPSSVFVTRDGSTIHSVGTSYEASGSGGSAGISFLQTSVLCADFPGSGYHEYYVFSGNAGGIGGVSIAVLEMAR